MKTPLFPHFMVGCNSPSIARCFSEPLDQRIFLLYFLLYFILLYFILLYFHHLLQDVSASSQIRRSRFLFLLYFINRSLHSFMQNVSFLFRGKIVNCDVFFATSGNFPNLIVKFVKLFFSCVKIFHLSAFLMAGRSRLSGARWWDQWTTVDLCSAM